MWVVSAQELHKNIFLTSALSRGVSAEGSLKFLSEWWVVFFSGSKVTLFQMPVYTRSSGSLYSTVAHPIAWILKYYTEWFKKYWGGFSSNGNEQESKM